MFKWKNRVISHQKVNITRRPTFMEVQTAFSPPHQLFKSKMRTKSEEKTHIFAYRWAPMYHDEYGLWFAIWIFFWAIKLNSTAISIFFRKLRRQCCLNQVWELTTHACIVDAQTLKLVILHPASSNVTFFCWLSFLISMPIISVKRIVWHKYHCQLQQARGYDGGGRIGDCKGPLSLLQSQVKMM